MRLDSTSSRVTWDYVRTDKITASSRIPIRIRLGFGCVRIETIYLCRQKWQNHGLENAIPNMGHSSQKALSNSRSKSGRYQILMASPPM
jgi:hypothetical protein